MTNRRIDEIFDEAAALTTGQRASYLDRACAGDDALRREVESLLAADASAPAFMAAPAIPATGALRQLAALGPGARVGPYRIVRVIGTGGMGTVFRAIQDRPRRDVALKVLRSSVVTAAALRRFEYEAELLGRLSHPGIARVYDAGTWEDGAVHVPYFAMEYVADAQSIVQYAAGLGVDERLGLFLAACDAVHHGHQRGIIHRDLKPENILVERGGQVKVIDFGVARTVEVEPGFTAARTQVGHLVGTLQYMSPEQFDADGSPPDTRCDVYALGLVLYELLCDQRPYDVSRVSISEAARIVRDEKPRRLSSVDRVLRGDLRTIVAKALEKDRERRYESAAELARDVRRYLAHQPIAARPASMTYQMRMFARRHKPIVAAFVLTLAALVTATAVSAVFAIRSDRARAAAELRAYVANVSAAAGALRVNDVRTARRQLDAAPVARRNWEWRYLVGQLDRSRRTFTLRDEETTLDGDDAAQTAHVFLRYGPAGRRLGVATVRARGDDRESLVRVLDAADGSAAGVPFRIDAATMRFCFEPGGGWMAIAAGDGTVRVWDPDAGVERRILRGHDGRVLCVAVSPDGTRIVSGGIDGTVRICDAATGALVQRLTGHESQVETVAFAPDGTRVVSGGGDQTARVWSVGTGSEIAILRGHENALLSVAFDPGGNEIASGARDGTVRLWDAATGEARAVLRGHEADVASVAFSPDGAQLLSTSYDHTARLWRAADGAPLGVLRGHGGWVISGVFSPDGSGIATGGMSPDDSDSIDVKIWDADEDTSSILLTHDHLVLWVGFTPDGETVVSAGGDSIVLSDVRTGDVIRTIHGRDAVSVGAAIDSTGTFVAAGRNDETIGVWRLDSGVLAMTLAGLRDGAMGVAFSPDGRLLASASSDETVKLWRVEDGQEVATLRGHDDWVWSVAFSPDGRHLASASRDSTIRIWDVDSARLRFVLDDHEGTVNSVAFSHDGALLASASGWSGDRTVRLWDVARGRLVATLSADDHVTDVVFSPDDARLAASLFDKTVRLWDVGSGAEVLTLRGHTHWVHAVAFSPDGRRLATGGGSYEDEDCTVRLWETREP